MKINKKVLIPLFATAMGLSAIGGISGSVAWYQYNTKVTSSWIGASMGDGGVLQVSDNNGTSWKRDVDFGSASTKLHPITYGALASNAALSGTPKKHPQCGVTDPADWDDAVLGTDYFQYTFKMRARKLVDDEYVGVAAQISIKEFVLQSTTSGKTDVTDAVRIHISDGTNHKLLSANGGNTAMSGNLDLDGDGVADTKGGYQWTSGRDDTLTYGVSGNQASVALANNTSLFEIPAEGATITITIWLEGWQILRSGTMAMWDPSKDAGANIQLGLTFDTPASTFFTDLPTNP